MATERNKAELKREATMSALDPKGLERPQYWKRQLKHGIQYAVKQLHFNDKGSALKWVCEYHPQELEHAISGWSDQAPLFSENIWAEFPAASPKGQVEAVADDGRTLAHNLADIARSLLSRPPELRGPFRLDEEALRRVAALPPRTSRSALSPAPSGGYEPTIIHNEEAGISELVLRDCPTYVAEELTVRAVRDMSDRSLLGFQWPAPSGGWQADDETLRYVLRYGGRCRDCADEMGVCPHRGLPCEVEPAKKAIKHVISALNYGVKHGYLPVAPSQVEG